MSRTITRKRIGNDEGDLNVKQKHISGARVIKMRYEQKNIFRQKAGIGDMMQKNWSVCKVIQMRQQSVSDLFDYSMKEFMEQIMRASANRTLNDAGKPDQR
ncbi:MAG: hypothetical protein J0H74_18580 [Chitinophagaceae bacterium]|nr:hypothetical protein [Chitinophagaceae bacterium]